MNLSGSFLERSKDNTNQNLIKKLEVGDLFTLKANVADANAFQEFSLIVNFFGSAVSITLQNPQ